MRVMIATATAGGGHVAAAAALEEAWRACRPGDVVETVDVVKFFSPLHRQIHGGGYLKLVEHAPEVWGMVFKKTDDPGLARRLNRLRRAFPSKSRALFAAAVAKFAPDVVVCTHYGPIETLGGLRLKAAKPKRRKPGTPPLTAPAPHPRVVSVVTDFEAHALWMDPCVDLYCLAAEETRARLLARGVPEDRALATGIPIALKFAAPIEAGAVRKTLGLRDDLAVVLVLSGGFGTGPVAGILGALDKVRQPFQTVVVTGRNEDLRRDLAAQDRTHPTHVLGFARNMHELMGMAALVLSKPGGLTTSEALALGKPILVISPIPGQEAANSDFLLEHGAAAKVNRLDDLPFRVAALLGSPRLAEMSEAARALGRPAAARHICEEVGRRFGGATAGG